MLIKSDDVSINPTIPITKSILKILDPKILPNRKSILFLLMDAILAASSGILVPIAVIDNPIM